MSDRVHKLLMSGQINDEMYMTYMIFEADERGHAFLKKLTKALFLEEASEPKGDLFTWMDGRKSLVRDITHHIDNVKKLLEEFEQ